MGRLDHTVLLERGPLWHSFLPYLHTGQNNKNKDKKKKQNKNFLFVLKIVESGRWVHGVHDSLLSALVY